MHSPPLSKSRQDLLDQNIISKQLDGRGVDWWKMDKRDECEGLKLEWDQIVGTWERRSWICVWCCWEGKGKDAEGGCGHQNKTGDSSDILKWAEGGKMGVRTAWAAVWREAAAMVGKGNGGEKWMAVTCCSLSCETVKQWINYDTKQLYR